MRNRDNFSKNRLRFTFVLLVATILLVAVAIIVVLEYVLILSGIGSQEDLEKTGTYWIFVFGVSSTVIGLVLAFLLSRLVLRPFDKLIEGMSLLARGNFSVRMDFGERKYLEGLSESFNSLATELQNTEILRSDFVNNFSHELKTPIASVSSLISLLKNEDLPKEKRLKYLNVIAEEMDRLSSMTTNILNLTKIENQEILTEKTKINLSEQIRNCVLLLEKKWTKKRLNLLLDFDEIEIVANEDMFKQVWLNLLDNGVKFASIGGDLQVKIIKEDKVIFVMIKNSGSEIPVSEYEKIFNKFYRIEKEGKSEGNGIGLSIVKHIVELHGGSVNVQSGNNKTEFIVELPTI